MGNLPYFTNKLILGCMEGGEKEGPKFVLGKSLGEKVKREDEK